MGNTLSKRQKGIIIGSILGDGHLEFDGYLGTRLQIKQSKKYKEYVIWLHKELKNLCKSMPRERKDTSQWYFSTRYLKELTELRDKFYGRHKKIIPSDIIKMLKSSLSLAVWYMDDGTLDWRPKDHYAFSVATHCFSIEDNYRLIETLKKIFRVSATVQTTLIRGKRYPRIYIGATGRNRFLKVIKPYILSCFFHKLPPLL